jgi:spermidine dehydrogenase
VEDIAAITVNRWGHGYAYWNNPVLDTPDVDGNYPNVVGRQKLGRISIANSDAEGSVTIHAAIDQAHRAITEIIKVS